MLSVLRQKYWIPYVTCRRIQGNVGEQKMADLPKDRITPGLTPFTIVGVDYFCPTEVKQGRNTVKRYRVIFTCLASCAVHLEVAHSLDTD